MKIKDYPPVFWSALFTTIVGGYMSISAYSAMMPGSDALIRAAGIFISLECVNIFAAMVLNSKGQGLLPGLAFVLMFGCASAEIFLGATELQRGIMQSTEIAAASKAGTANNTATANALTEANKGIADCQKRYPRKKRDEAARNNCVKPFNDSLKTLSATKPAEVVAFNADASAMSALWESIAELYNDNFADGDKVSPGKVSLIVMLFIFTLFVIGKLFLWAKYSKWKNEHGFNDESNSSTVVYPENEIGELKDPVIENQSESKTRPGFGLIPTGRAVLSSADRNRNRALQESVTQSPVTQVTVSTGNCKLQEPVNTGNCNTDNGDELLNSYLSTAYAKAQAAKVGQTVDCPMCGKTFVKANKWHTFCSNNRKPRQLDGGNCSDEYHNAANPDRLQALKAKRKAKQ